MTERYPTDATLLSLNEDTATGVPYIPTGQSPYHLDFRKMLQRTLLATSRANDLRVYQDGDLTVGVRAGRCQVQGNVIDFAGQAGVTAQASATTHVWIDSAGVVQTGTSGLPSDRTAFLPLAEVTADATAITSLLDLRGEAFLQSPALTALGLTATAEEVNQALDGIDPSVTVAALNTLTAGQTSTADFVHRHLQVWQDDDAEVQFTLINNNAGSASNVGLVLALPNVLADGLALLPDRGHGFLTQRFNGTTYHTLGASHVQFQHEGALVATASDKLVGGAPIDGVVTGVVLSAGANIESDTSTDGLSATVKVNGTAVTATDPALTDADGAGFRSTDQGDGVASVIKSDGTEIVSRGDVLTVDLVRSVTGSVTTEASDVVVLIVVRASRPE